MTDLLSDTSNKVEEMLDNTRWLMSNGLIPEHVQNSLFVYGSLAHPDVLNVSVEIDTENKSIVYTLFVKDETIINYNIFKQRIQSQKLWDLWRAKRTIKTRPNIPDINNIKLRLVNFVKDLCGPMWSIKLTVKLNSEHKEEDNE